MLDIDSSKFDSIDQANRSRLRQRRTTRFLVATSIFSFISLMSFLIGPGLLARWSYSPEVGDIIFQSLQPAPLVNAIEGVTQSPFSHCGIVMQKGGQTYVCEAFDGVEMTPLKEFLKRGRRQGFAVYRVKEMSEAKKLELTQVVQAYLGRPYDVRYRMDDENIYCSELIYKGWQQIFPKQSLGRLRRLGEMNWQPYQETIRFYEQGPVPLDREMITPVDLAQAEQLQLHYSFRIDTPE